MTVSAADSSRPPNDPGESSSVDRFTARFYGELHDLAQSFLRHQRPGHTLQTTALVNEAYLRLAASDVEALDRQTFLALAARVMRQILVNHAKKRRTLKRGGGKQRLELQDDFAISDDRVIDLLALDESMQRLAEIDPKQARIVELRFFGGLTTAETAEVLNTSARSVERRFRMARAWLRTELGDPG